MCPDRGTALWLGCVPTGALLVPSHTNQVPCSSGVLLGFSIHVLLNNQPLCCTTGCVSVASLCAARCAWVPKIIAKICFLLACFKMSGGWSQPGWAPSDKLKRGVSVALPALGLGKRARFPLHRIGNRVHVSQAAFSSVVLHAWGHGLLLGLHWEAGGLQMKKSSNTFKILVHFSTKWTYRTGMQNEKKKNQGQFSWGG